MLHRVISERPRLDPGVTGEAAAIVRDCLTSYDRRPAAGDVAERIAALASG